MGWFRRKAEPKSEHPSAYPVWNAHVEDDTVACPVAFTSDGSILHPPQNTALGITIIQECGDDLIPLDEALTYPPRRGPRADASIISKRYQ